MTSPAIPEEIMREARELADYLAGLVVDNANAAAVKRQAKALIARALMAARADERIRVLDAASDYLRQQYGIGALSHPVDRERIAAAIETYEVTK